MKIALMHYHLKQGGVTTVIRHQAEAMQAVGWEPLVLTGAPPEGPFPCDVQVVEGLAYDRHLPPGMTAADIAHDIVDKLGSKWSGGPDLLHVHNPTLAKNRYLQEVLNCLQQEGISLLCQIHDFAEDGRPDAYYRKPYLDDCHYAAINPRDHQLLLDAGLSVNGCHLLPNTITNGPLEHDDIPARYGVLYPVRAIRRKNIGEAVLLALFLGKQGPVRITLPPNSPKDFQVYQYWKNFVQQHQLPVQFDVGLDADFRVLMASSHFVITTSINEGFGFAFLEPWAAGKALWGRLLPDICKGFTDNGLRLDGLYSQLKVPLSWIERHRLKSQWTSALASARKHFGLKAPQEVLDTAWQSVSGNGHIDFGLLDESFQAEIILRLQGTAAERRRFTALNPFLEKPRPPVEHKQVVTANAAVIERCYRPGAYARQLEAIYRQAVSRPVHHKLDKDVLVNAFLSPNRFSLLKWGQLHG